MEDEQVLIEKAQGGEGAAFGKLYDQYLNRIYRFVRVKVSRREEAEDLTHQAFLNAWKNIDQYSSQGYTFGTWLYKIARNALVDHYRKLPKAGEVSLDETIGNPNTEPADMQTKTIENSLDTNLKNDVIFQALRHLKESEQDVIIMRIIEDMTVKETAEILERSETAVKVIQHRAIKRIQELLRKKNYE